MAKLYASSSDGSTNIDPIVEKFCFAKDVILDKQLVYYDILGSMAHSSMLNKIGIIDNDEIKVLHSNLTQCYTTYKSGKWTIETQDEDVHTAVENRLGEVGKKLHTARSRNDQVLTDMRLYSKDHFLKIILACHQLSTTIAKSAQKFEHIPMPGYTHLQRAMPSSYGMWLGSFAEYLFDTIRECKNAYSLLDQSPLGSGAGYGVSLDIDRNISSELLGFARVQKNSIYCQNSRGYLEGVMLSALTSVMMACSRLSSDVCLYCSQEFNFLQLPDQFFTGSSIMPQKKNPDLFELIRAKVNQVNALCSSVRLIPHGLNSGYSKDLQEIKEPTFIALETVQDTLEVLNLVMVDIEPKTESLKNALSPDLFAAHEAYQLVKEGIPFREAYRQIKQKLDTLTVDNAEQCVLDMKHIGATGNLELNKLVQEIELSLKDTQSTYDQLQSCWNNLLKK